MADNNNLFPEINPNRVITMSCSGTGGEDSWKYNLSRLLGLRDYEGRVLGNPSAYMFDNASTWDVNPKIKLLMTKNKALSSQSNPDEPLKGLASVGSGGGIIGKIGKFAIGTATALSTLQDIKEGATGGSFYPWIAGIKAWNGGNSINLQYDFEFAMGQYGLWNAEEEVVKPILNLLAPTLPQYLDAIMIYGSYPNSWNLLATFIKHVWDKFLGSSESSVNTGDGHISNASQNHGPVDAYANEFSSTTTTTEGSKSSFSLESIATSLEELVLGEYKSYTYDIKFGNLFTFYKMLPTAASVELSNDVDQYGFPISGTINMTFTGLMPLALSTLTPEELAMKFNGQVHYN